ncbi:MAG TPA: flavin reductase [Bacteroidales bacterium]|nr:flavin reductase [Bacteroidales bacterium]
MNTDFIPVDPQDVTDNVFKLIGDDWMLITAGDENHFNTMTASWGGLGVLWNLPVAVCYIRPQRYTFGFAEKCDYYTLAFFGGEHRKILNFCGSKSGRDYDKIKETGLEPFVTEKGNIGYNQARLIMECKKLYADDLKADNFLLPDIIKRNYPKSDFHRFYIAQVTDVWIRK